MDSLCCRKHVVPFEDILKMHNVDGILIESARYNARILCHYISWALKICIENLNGVNNDVTLIKCFTQ